ncbi:hypothetical protein FACS1894206_00260 [Deltaproteobacteria bacterium]|nr:hypothetical protein FACS1894206_00260 [Deltaproteobacteria bacterium]
MRSIKKQCLLHANCQGEPLAELLRLSSDFCKNWDITHYTNYIKEPVPAAALQNCDFFIYQNLDAKWGELASASMLERLNPQAERFCMPTMFFKGCWPFWTSQSPINFGDAILNQLIDAGAGKPEILKIYLRGNIGNFVDLRANLESTFTQEEEKEKQCDLRTVPLVRELWQREMLFYTCNHPAKRLLALLANTLLKRLGLKELPESVIKEYEPEYAEFELPVHPQLAEFFAMRYARAGYEFRIFKRRMDFGRYISRYIDCRLQGMDKDFIGFLQVV